MKVLFHFVQKTCILRRSRRTTTVIGVLLLQEHCVVRICVCALPLFRSDLLSRWIIWGSTYQYIIELLKRFIHQVLIQTNYLVIQNPYYFNSYLYIASKKWRVSFFVYWFGVVNILYSYLATVYTITFSQQSTVNSYKNAVKMLFVNNNICYIFVDYLAVFGAFGSLHNSIAPNRSLHKDIHKSVFRRHNVRDTN